MTKSLFKMTMNVVEVSHLLRSIQDSHLFDNFFHDNEYCIGPYTLFLEQCFVVKLVF